MLNQTVGQLYDALYRSAAAKKMGTEEGLIRAQTKGLTDKVRVLVGSGDNRQLMELSPSKAADTILKQQGLTNDEKIIGLRTTALELNRLATVADGLLKHDQAAMYRAEARKADALAEKAYRGDFDFSDYMSILNYNLARGKEGRLSGEAEKKRTREEELDLSKAEKYITEKPTDTSAVAYMDDFNSKSSAKYVYAWSEDRPGFGYGKGAVRIKLQPDNNGYIPTAKEFTEYARSKGMTVSELAERLGWKEEKI